jgi:hypothetical protein
LSRGRNFWVSKSFLRRPAQGLDFFGGAPPRPEEAAAAAAAEREDEAAQMITLSDVALDRADVIAHLNTIFLGVNVASCSLPAPV